MNPYAKHDQLLDEVEHFFISYHEAKGKKFKPLGRFGPKRARKLVKQGESAAGRLSSRKGTRDRGSRSL